MSRFFNTLDSPVLINDKGQTLDGFTWLTSEETPEIEAARSRGELIIADNKGNIIEEKAKPKPSKVEDPTELLSPENASKTKKSEG